MIIDTLREKNWLSALEANVGMFFFIRLRRDLASAMTGSDFPDE